GEEQQRRDRVGRGANVERRPRQLLVPEELRRERQDRRRPGKAAGEEVGGDLPRPDGLLEHRPAVVGARLAHPRPVRNAPTIPTASTAAAAAMFSHIEPSCFVATTGSGGSP